MLGVKVQGQPAMACGCRPLYRGDLHSWETGCLPHGSINLDYDEGWNLFCGIAFDAVNSVACLECGSEDSGSDVYVLAGT